MITDKQWAHLRHTKMSDENLTDEDVLNLCRVFFLKDYPPCLNDPSVLNACGKEYLLKQIDRRKLALPEDLAAHIVGLRLAGKI